MAKTATSTEAIASPVPKGTKATEIILGTAAVKLGTGVKALTEMMEEVNKMGTVITENSLLISSQEDKLESLSLELRNTIAQNKIEIEQAYESDKKTFVQKWLDENNSIAMDKLSLTKMEQELQEVTDTKEEEIKKQTSAAIGAITSKHNSEKREMELQFKATEAENKAALNQKDDKIKFLEDQAAAWRKALENEQEAGIKRAQAGAIQQTITSGK